MSDQVNMTVEDIAPRIQLRAWQHCAIFLFACIVIVSRRPDALFHPQFWAEDGHVWFADAYNLGWWATLFRTQDGYFQTLPRLGAGLSLLVPMAMAPLVLNLIAIAVQVLPVNLLLSSRSSAWGSLRFRASLAVMYLILPNLREMNAIITSSQWVLALCAFLILAASPPASFAARVFDISVVFLCGLTGPFCFFLLPAAIFFAWKRPAGWRWKIVGILAVLSLVQAWGLLVVNPAGRAHAPLGASPATFVHILAGHVYLATLLGGNVLALNTTPAVLILLICAAIGGTGILGLCFARSSVNMRAFLVLTAMLFAASFISPAAYPPAGVSRWEVLAGASGIRYWFFPTLAFAWSLLWIFHNRTSMLKSVGALLLCVMCFGIVRDWRIPAFKDLHFAEDARRFEAAPAGTAVTIPENPRGWNIRLVRHTTDDQVPAAYH